MGNGTVGPQEGSYFQETKETTLSKKGEGRNDNTLRRGGGGGGGGGGGEWWGG